MDTVFQTGDQKKHALIHGLDLIDRRLAICFWPWNSVRGGFLPLSFRFVSFTIIDDCMTLRFFSCFSLCPRI